MSSPDKTQAGLKKKLLQKVKVYWVYVGYLTLVFGSFIGYRRLILTDVGITYTEYGVALMRRSGSMFPPIGRNGKSGAWRTCHRKSNQSTVYSGGRSRF